MLLTVLKGQPQHTIVGLCGNMPPFQGLPILLPLLFYNAYAPPPLICRSGCYPNRGNIVGSGGMPFHLTACNCETAKAF